MEITLEEKKSWSELGVKSAFWLNDNFHKFSLTNKIKIALEVFKRSCPTMLEHSGKIEGGETKIIFVVPKEKQPDYDNRIAETLRA